MTGYVLEGTSTLRSARVKFLNGSASFCFSHVSSRIPSSPPQLIIVSAAPIRALEPRAPLRSFLPV